MNSFIQNHISIVNKNNHIVLNLGKKCTEQIFEQKFNKKTIENFLQNLKNNFNPYFKTSFEKVYSTRNYNITISKKVRSSYTYEITDSIIEDFNNCSALLKLKKLLDFQEDAISTNSYQTIETRQILRAEINNMIHLEISEYDLGYFTISIIVKKPNDYNKITQKIKEIISFIS